MPKIKLEVFSDVHNYELKILTDREKKNRFSANGILLKSKFYIKSNIFHIKLSSVNLDNNYMVFVTINHSTTLFNLDVNKAWLEVEIVNENDTQISLVTSNHHIVELEKTILC